MRAPARELYAFNEHEKMQPASLAKMMTFYLTLEALHQKRIALDTQVTISEAAWRLSLNDTVSRMFLQVGQKVAVHDLLYGLMVSSGNDAAVALAEYLAGSSDAFAQQMNNKAQQLGLTETHFTNPDGLPVRRRVHHRRRHGEARPRDLLERFPDAHQLYLEPRISPSTRSHQPQLQHAAVLRRARRRHQDRPRRGGRLSSGRLSAHSSGMRADLGGDGHAEHGEAARRDREAARLGLPHLQHRAS